MAPRLFGIGRLQAVTGHLVHIIQSTVYRAVGKVTVLIAKHLRPMLVRFSLSARFPKVMRDFHEVAGFPGLTGSIDCPNVQSSHLICNIFDIVAGWPGSVHDSRTFDNSRLRVLCEESRVPDVLRLDTGYQEAYMARNIVESVWKHRVPRRDMGLQHKAENVVLIMTAFAALHNLALYWSLLFTEFPLSSIMTAARSRRMNRKEAKGPNRITEEEWSFATQSSELSRQT
ncbi:uncharacterized protein [Dermacentor albipictus]|uniref:uncharacterized protein n=1 Tax=Dermacentor albipictus TaxID=60249 RepID=UPI0038FC6664